MTLTIRWFTQLESQNFKLFAPNLCTKSFATLTKCIVYLISLSQRSFNYPQCTHTCGLLGMPKVMTRNYVRTSDVYSDVD